MSSPDRGTRTRVDAFDQSRADKRLVRGHGIAIMGPSLDPTKSAFALTHADRQNRGVGGQEDT